MQDAPMPDIDLKILVEGTEVEKNVNRVDGYTEVAKTGLIDNVKNTKSMQLYGDIKVIMMDWTLEINKIFVIEFDFTLGEEIDEKHGVCITLDGSERCYYIGGSSSSINRDDLYADIYGDFAQPTIKSTFRISFQNLFVTGVDSVTLKNLSFLQENKVEVRRGRSLFANILVYPINFFPINANLDKSVKLVVPTSIPNDIHFKPEISIQDSYGDYSRQQVAETGVITRDGGNNIEIRNLTPGRRYRVSYDITKQNKP